MQAVVRCLRKVQVLDALMSLLHHEEGLQQQTAAKGDITSHAMKC